MPDAATHSIASDSNPAIEEFFVLNPPVETVLNEWHILSKKDIPARRKPVEISSVKVP